MNRRLIPLAIIFAAALTSQPLVHAASTTLAMEQMAEIVLSMENQPNKDARITLDDIAKDSSSTGNERQLASIIMNMDKKLRPDDKPVVMKIWLSPSASETERSLAKALLKFNEKPDDSVKAALSQFPQTGSR